LPLTGIGVRTRKTLKRAGLAWSLLALIGVANGDPGSVGYQYDELGRLKSATYDDQSAVGYQLDAAGNRVKVTDGHAPGLPGAPTVPASSITGTYSIAWTAPTAGIVTGYMVNEATDANFTNISHVYNVTAPSLTVAVTGLDNGKYYYQV